MSQEDLVDLSIADQYLKRLVNYLFLFSKQLKPGRNAELVGLVDKLDLVLLHLWLDVVAKDEWAHSLICLDYVPEMRVQLVV